MSTYPKLTYKKDGTPRIPRGWRKLRPGERVNRHDLNPSFDSSKWIQPPWLVWEGDPAYGMTFIRRVINRTAPKKRC